MKWMVEIYYSEKNYPDGNILAACDVYNVSTAEEAMAAAISELRKREAIGTISVIRVEPVANAVIFNREDVDFSDVDKFVRPISATVDNLDIRPIW